jgi:hypothetical protein
MRASVCMRRSVGESVELKAPVAQLDRASAF